MPESLGAIKQGVFGVTDIYTEQRKYDKDKSKFFIWRERGYASFTSTLITLIKKAVASDMEPKHFEDGYRRFDIALTGLTISALSGTAPEYRDITFSTSSSSAQYVGNFQVGQVWENSSIFCNTSDLTVNPTFNLTRSEIYAVHELMLVTAVVLSTGVVTFRRHLGIDTVLGTSVATATTHTLHLHPIAVTDGSDAPTSFSQNAVVVNNYLQIVEEPFEYTDHSTKTGIFGEDEPQRKARNARRNFSRAVDRMFMSGHMYRITDGGEYRWYSGGADEWIPFDAEHRINFNAVPTYSNLNTKLENVFMYGSDEKYGFCGYSVLTKLSNAFGDALRFNDKLATAIGLSVKSLEIGSGGVVHFIPNFEMSKTGKSTDLNILDIKYFQYMFIEGEDIHIRKGNAGVGLQLPGEKKMKQSIYGTIGLKRTFKDSHFQVYNIL